MSRCGPSRPIRHCICPGPDLGPSAPAGPVRPNAAVARCEGGGPRPGCAEARPSRGRPAPGRQRSRLARVVLKPEQGRPGPGAPEVADSETAEPRRATGHGLKFAEALPVRVACPTLPAASVEQRLIVSLLHD